MKKLTTLFISLILAIALCFPVFGANTTVKGEKCITITGLDADWHSTANGYPQALDVWAVVFYPSATDDRMILNDNGADNDAFYDSGLCADTYDARVVYFAPGTKVKPYFDTDDAVLGTAANAKVKIYFR